MTTIACEEFERCIALGEHPSADHLGVCPTCRVEVRRLDDLFGMLASEAHAMVPSALDQAVCRSLRTVPLGRPSRRWSAAAMVLAGLGLVTTGTGISMMLAQTGMGPAAPEAAILAIVAYLALSGAALLPVFFRTGAMVGMEAGR